MFCPTARLLLLPCGSGKRRSLMEQNQNNYITLEMNLKLQMKDYRIVLGIKRAWIVALGVFAIQLATWLLKDRH